MHSIPKLSVLVVCPPQFDYIYWTGDLPAHDIWEQPRDTQLASLHRIIDMIHKYFPGKPVYPSLGNHESSPVNRLVNRDVRFSSKVSQIGPKWDKSGTFSDKIKYSLDQIG